MLDWFWRVFALNTVFTLACLFSYLNAEDRIQKLPFCNPDTGTGAKEINDLVIVSTLDGRISAFATDSGIKAWDLQTQPLLSSNLHHVELTSGGKWVRLIPSLRGTLYSLSGDTIEPLPFDAEQLLSSSFKYSEELVIAGARESLWTGVDAATGGVIYSCGSAGCSGEREAGGARGVLVLRRNSNVVRALEPRTGTEKWNFSVAEHQLALSVNRECLGSASRGPSPSDYSVVVALPEGMVAVTHYDQPHALIWQHKLEAPVAGMWRLRDGSLQNIDILWAASKALSGETFVQATPPSLYIGLHDQQLYVQEGLLHIQKSETAVATKPVPWKLVHTRPLIAGPNSAKNPIDFDPNALSLIALYGNTGQVGNQGYFLYSSDTCDRAVQVSDGLDDPDILLPDNDSAPDHHHVHVHVYSLWFWWKEVLLIAISSALLMNLMIWPRFFAPRLSAPSPLPVREDLVVVERHYSAPAATGDYGGRYESDFTPLRCLGRGGFGVVFEARNNIDHCSYAVKRITLPRRQSKRERVLREVRALAKLEHEHIVRYFNAWLEEPPPRWQEERDAVWMRELDGVSVAMHEETSQRETPDTHHVSSRGVGGVGGAGGEGGALPQPPGDRSVDACFDALEYDKQLGELCKRNRSLSCNDSFSIIFDDNVTKASKGDTLTGDLSLPNNMIMTKNLGGGDEDSFIVFANTEDLNHNSKGLSDTKNDSSINKPLELVKKCDDYTQSQSEPRKLNKKKGHTRHWSLDMCVKSSSEGATQARRDSKMYLYIQMQLCLRDSLHDWLRHNRTYQARANKATSLFSQIVSAVEYVHLAGLIHRDLKPSNIFFAPDGRVKVGDFGLVTAMADSSQDGDCGPADAAGHAQDRHTYRVGTHLYMSPEQLRGRPYSYKVDIYSLGLILFELLQPFGTESERINCLLRLREGAYPKSFQDNYPKEMDVLRLMLSEDPSCRPTAAGVRARAPLHQDTDSNWHFTLPQTT